MSRKKHLAGDVQRTWVAGAAEHPQPRERHCPNCGKPMTHWKRACTAACHAELVAKDGGE